METKNRKIEIESAIISECEEGIVEIFCKKGVELTKEQAKMQIDSVYELSEKGRKAKILVDLLDISYVGKEVRDVLDEETAKNTSAIAIVVGSPISCILGNLFANFSSRNFPVAVFESKKEATSWLIGSSVDVIENTTSPEITPPDHNSDSFQIFKLTAFLVGLSSFITGIFAGYFAGDFLTGHAGMIFSFLSFAICWNLPKLGIRKGVAIYLALWAFLAVLMMSENNWIAGPYSSAMIPLPLVALLFYSKRMVAGLGLGVILLYFAFYHFFQVPSENSMTALFLQVTMILTNCTIGIAVKAYFESKIQKSEAVLADGVDVIISFTKQNFKPKVSYVGDEHLDSLADGINALGEELNHSVGQLKSYQEHLETLVTKRTEKLEQTQAALVESSKLAAIGEMSAGVSHEINNPLAVIRTRASQVSRLADKGLIEVPQVKEFAEIILVSSEKIAQTVRDLGSLLGNTSGGCFEKVSLRQTLESAVIFSKQTFCRKDTTIDIEPFSSDVLIDCKPAEIEKAFVSLLKNSCDSFGERKNNWIRIYFADKGGFYEVRFTDSGPGINPEIRNKIMEPFFTTKDVGEGVGLGLSLSKGIMKHHQGDLRLDTCAINTSFILSFPKTGLSSNKEPKVS